GAVQKNDAILHQVVERSEFIPEQRFARLGDDVLFDIDPVLRNLLADRTNHAAPRRLQFGEARFDGVGLLAALEMLAALANPFFAFLNQVGELVRQFRGEKLQNGYPEEQIHFDVLVIFRRGQRAVEHLSEQLTEGGSVERLSGAQFDAWQISFAGVLANEV